MADDETTAGPKKYGLIMPSKRKSDFAPTATRLKPKLFDEDDGLERGNPSSSSSSSDEGAPTDWVQETLKTQTLKKKHLSLTYQKALAEDPTIYQFDEVYDDIKALRERRTEEKAGENSASGERPKSRYVETLQKAAERRRREHERRQERRIQKEREEEADKFDDKEIFVTAAYRAKMEEMQADEEAELRKRREDEATDVTKQSDLSGFYRHIYRETFDTGASTETETSENNSVSSSVPVPVPVPVLGKWRQYRARRRESASPSPEPEPSAVGASCPVDANPDLDLSGSDDDKGEKSPPRSPKKTADMERRWKRRKSPRSESEFEFKKPSDVPPHDDQKGKKKKKEQRRREKEEGGDVETTTTTRTKRKRADVRELFDKRTVGDVLIAALERYYTRKSFGISGLGSGLG